MATNEYLCLACGGFSHSVQSQEEGDDMKCAKCGSSNIMKLDESKLFGFFTGGG